MSRYELSQDDLLHFFNMNLDLSCVATMEGYFLKINGAWKNTLGYEEEDLMSRQFLEFIHPDDVQPTLDVMARIAEGVKLLNFVNRYKHKDGSYRYFEWCASLGEKNIYATARDITHHKEREENLRQERERMRAVWESQNSYVIRTDMNGCYTFANQKYIDDYGWVHDGKIIGSYCMPAISPTHQAAAQEAVNKCVAQIGKSFQVELDKPLRDGGRTTTLWDFVCLTDKDGTPTEIQCLGINISERKRQEEERMKQQQFDLLEMATPITQLWEGILLLPLVGLMSAQRAQSIMMSVLRKISETQAKVFILDIGGVAVVDTEVANHFIKLAKATRLMGCTCTISGISPAVSQTIIELGIQTDELNTTGTMRDALERALALTGSRLVKN